MKWCVMFWWSAFSMELFEVEECWWNFFCTARMRHLSWCVPVILSLWYPRGYVRIFVFFLLLLLLFSFLFFLFSLIFLLLKLSQFSDASSPIVLCFPKNLYHLIVRIFLLLWIYSENKTTNFCTFCFALEKLFNCWKMLQVFL